MYNFQPKFFNLFFLIVFEIKMLLNYTHGLLSLVELKRNLFKYTLSSIYAVYVYTKFHLHGIWVWSHSSVYTLTSPLFTRFWVKIYSIILFTWFSIYAFFPGKQNMCKLRSRGRIWILKNSNFGGKYYTYWCLCILHVSFEIELSLLVNRGSTHFSENLKTYVV